jgi:hypothetical protein
MTAIEAAAHAPWGAPLSAWEDAIRANVQAQIEAAVLTLSHAVPGMLADDGAKHHRIEVVLTLPHGEWLKLTASVEVVE